MMSKVCGLPAIVLIILTSACSNPLPSSPPPAGPTVFNYIVYYHLAFPGDEPLSEDSVIILLNELFLSPAESDQTFSTNTASDIRAALEAMIFDVQNDDVVGDLVISDITFIDGHAEISLQGNVHAAGDIILIAVRMMVLLTVFSNETVETALVTLNGKNIANLGLSFSASAHPEDYLYTRSEIEDFIIENYVTNPG